MPSVTSSTLSARQRGIPVVRRQDPLAADRVVGRHLLAQLGILDLRVDVRARRPLDAAWQPRRRRQPGHERLARPGRCRARTSRCARGNRAVERALDVGDRPVGVRHDPRRRALEDVQLPTSGWICGTTWIDDAPVPTTATRSPSRSMVVVPARGVHRRALERVEAGDVGIRAARSAAPKPPTTTRARDRARRASPAASAAPRSSHSRASTSRPKRMWSRTPKRSRSARGSARSRAARSTCGSSRGSARTSTSTGATGCRTGSRDRC